ncbi:MAG: 30S ribosomal protein S8 [Planctomycetota bacterium]|nr:30S ribosomal protein S8 [Planctomycetota bacterium]
MPVTDPIADMLTRVRNAVHLRRETVVVRSSKIVISIAEALQREGFIKNFEIARNPKTPSQNDLKVFLKYGRCGEQVINLIERVSKPGRRIYAQKEQLKPVLRGMGCLVLTTSKGVLSDKEAREANVGGEVLVKVY